jgi:hypothetical protein
MHGQKNNKICGFSGETFKGLEVLLMLRVQRRHYCSPAASSANCIMTLYLFEEPLQTFLSISVTQKCQILSCDSLVANERYIKEVYSSILGQDTSCTLWDFSLFLSVPIEKCQFNSSNQATTTVCHILFSFFILLWSHHPMLCGLRCRNIYRRLNK